MNSFSDRILDLIIAIPVLIPALVLHEYAHAWVACKCGDTTAKDAGRLTLDPAVHFDPLGGLMIVITFLTHAPLFGWAKPVPVRFGQLRNPMRDMVLVAAAGPATNVLQGLLWYGILWIIHLASGGSSNLILDLAFRLAFTGIAFNVILTIFNLLPIPPLDGSRIAVGLLPYSIGSIIARAEPYGFMLLIAFLWVSRDSGLFSYVDRFLMTIMKTVS